MWIPILWMTASGVFLGLALSDLLFFMPVSVLLFMFIVIFNCNIWNWQGLTGMLSLALFFWQTVSNSWAAYTCSLQLLCFEPGLLCTAVDTILPFQLGSRITRAAWVLNWCDVFIAQLCMVCSKTNKAAPSDTIFHLYYQPKVFLMEQNMFYLKDMYS